MNFSFTSNPICVLLEKVNLIFFTGIVFILDQDVSVTVKKLQ